MRLCDRCVLCGVCVSRLCMRRLQVLCLSREHVLCRCFRDELHCVCAGHRVSAWIHVRV
jgi:hypothetical protein